MHRHSWFGYCCLRLSQDVWLSPASGQTLPDKELLFLCCSHLSVITLIGKLITNCTSGWQLLTGKSFYKANFSLPILFVLLGLLSVPLKIKMPFHIIRVFHTVRGCLQRTAAPKGANDSFFAVGIFSRRIMTRSLGVQSQVCGGTSSL